MVHTVVDGTYRQTNLTNESREYLAKRDELRLAEIALMRQRERVAEMRRHLPRLVVQNARWLFIILCSERNRARLARCARRGSTELTGSPITWGKISISRWLLLRIFRLCEHTLVREVGTGCVCSARAATPSNMTWAAKIGKGIKTPRFPCSREMRLARCATSTLRILAWLATFRSAVSTSLVRCGTFWTSHRREEEVGMPA